MKYIIDKVKIIYSVQLNKNDISKLDWLRLRVVFVLNIVFIVCLLPSIYNTISSADYISATISMISILSLIISCKLIVTGYIKPPIFITTIILPLLGFIIAFLGVVPYQALFAQLCLLFALSIWILNNSLIRITYSVIYLIGLFLLYHTHNSLIDTILPMLIILGYIVVFHVITHFIESQDRNLVESLAVQKRLISTLENKNDQLQTFSHIMTHDLKAPLNSISSFTQLLKKDIPFDSNETHDQYFNFILNSTSEMRTLIDELLLFQKIESEEIDFGPVNLNTIINEIESSYQNDQTENNISIELNNLPEVKGNRTLLKVLFGNLISNSIKYQPKEKENHIPSIKISSSSNEVDDSIAIYLSDNGIGIAEEYIKNLFAPFSRFHTSQEYEGTGLGMPICKSVMERHIGSIKLNETSKNGTTIKLTFPKMPIAN